VIPALGPIKFQRRPIACFQEVGGMDSFAIEGKIFCCALEMRGENKMRGSSGHVRRVRVKRVARFSKKAATIVRERREGGRSVFLWL